MAGLLAASISSSNDRIWAYLTVVLICTAAVALVDRTVGFTPAALWLLILTGTLHLAGGLIANPNGAGILYQVWIAPSALRFDQMVHVVGSVAATVTAWQVLGTWLGPGTPARTQAWLAALAGLGKGAVNEVVEFVMAVQMPTFVGGFANTGWDLVFDVVGVAAAALFLVASGASRRPAGPRQAAAAVVAP